MRFRVLSSLEGFASLVVAGVLALCFAGGFAPGAAMAASPAWSPVAATGPTVIPPLQSEVQKLYVDAEGGTFTLTDTPETTPALAYNATAAEVQSALERLAAVGSGNVHVTGGPGGHNAESPYVIAFGGALANTNVAQVMPNGSLLLNGSASSLTTVSGGVGTSELALMAQNIGGLESSGVITYRATLPSGITAVATPTTGGEGTSLWACGASTSSEIDCTWTAGVAPGQAPPPVDVVITSAPGTETGVVHMEVSGGGAGVALGELPLTVSATPAKPGAQSFVAGAYDANGNFDSRAGGHPYSASAAIFANTVRSVDGVVIPAGEFRDITVELPPGFLGDPVAVPACPESTPAENCKLDTMVGLVEPILAKFGSPGDPASVFSTQAPYGYPAKYRFMVSDVVGLNVVGSLRSDEDYGLNAASLNTPQVEQVYGTFFTFWGEPASHTHDSARCHWVFKQKSGCEASDVPNTAFLTNATNCAEQAANGVVTRLNATLWQDPGELFTNQVGIPAVTECDKLKFEAGFTFQPNGTASADSPTGFTTNLTVPSEGLTDPEKLTTPEQKKVVVTLPKGVVLNPSAAGGLGACSEAQIGLKGTGFAMPNPIRFNKEPNTCPESSKMGTVEIKTALLEEPLHGALYLAKQNENPFGALFAVYLVIEDPRHGIFVKLPGDTEVDPATGQITVKFDDLPQLPFESLKLRLKGGSRAPLATPSTCGTFTTKTVSTPWSAPESGAPFESEDHFNVESGPNGGPCVSSLAARPFSPGLSAGTASTTAGGFTPFSLSLSRSDGEQELSSLEVSAPPGFVGVLTGIPFCSEAAIKAAEANRGAAELASPSCPEASLLGSLTAGVGVGSTPFYAHGKAYLAGPYKEAPLSIVFVTPAVAGPFDLGDVVVRAGIYVDKETAKITVKTDQVPQILDGVPLQIRSIAANIDRPDFGVNPTSCEKFKITTTVHGDSGATATPSSPFQVGGCSSLGFKPQFGVSTSAHTSRANGASLSVRLAYPKGAQANLAKVKVDLPKQLPSRLTTLQKACPEATFDANPAGCPKESIIGSAKAITPILPVPLVGPAYFVSHGGAKFPELILVLQGYGITIDLRGETFISPAGITSSTFNTIPDVAVGSFELNLPEGPYSALAANGDLCSSKLTMPTLFVAQNGAQINQTTPIKTTGCATTKTLTRAQKLKQALKACHKLKNKTKRKACEAAAKKKFGPQSKGKTSKRRK